MKVIWRSDPLQNPIGLEARLIDIDGYKTLEARFSSHMTLLQKIRSVYKILTGRTVEFSAIYIGRVKEA
jgi:hypothetical protein